MKTLGIIGGLGPLASAEFYKKICKMTDASSDKEHIDAVITSFSSTPDRSAFVLGESDKSPLPKLKNALAILESCGAEVIVMPCNTADFFYDELHLLTSADFPSITRETVVYAYSRGARKLGIIATDGTVNSAIYHRLCDEYGITPLFPDKRDQTKIVNDIYSIIKAGNSDVKSVYSIAMSLLEKCDKVVFACTELSLIDISMWQIKNNIIDSTDVLARRAIELCGAKLRAEYIER